MLANVDRLTSERATRSADWLQSVATPAGGVPFCLASVDGFPKAPWWQATDPPEPDLNPTGRIIGLLRPVIPDHPWVVHAAAWCWDQVEALEVLRAYGRA